MLDPRSQLLLRNLDRLPAGDLVLVNPPVDGLADELRARDDLRLTLFTQDFADARAFETRRLAVQFGAEPARGTRADAVVVFHPKAREQADLLLFLARSLLASGGSIWIVGENKGGIRTTEKRLRDGGIAIDKVDSARHCQLLALAPKTLGATFAIDDWLSVVEIGIPGDAPLAVGALPGVFSSARLDEGTALLLECLGGIDAGRVLDMGCGCGVIGAVLKRRCPALSVEMVDSSALALRAAQETLRVNGLAATVGASDGFSAVKGTFDAILSNPPFHEGLATDYRFTERFIADAPRFLRPGGRLRLVANAHLKYVPVIEQAFGNCRTLAENTRFRVYEAVKR